MPRSSGSPDQIEVIVNGQAMRIPAGTRLSGLLRQLGIPEAGTAVELAGDIVPVPQFVQIRLQDGQRLEIVRMVGGG